MTKTETGGAAFPTGLKGKVVFGGGFYAGAHVPEYEATQAGMTLREYYAGQALAGMCQACGWQGGDFKRMSQYAVEAADELIAALRARGGTNAE